VNIGANTNVRLGCGLGQPQFNHLANVYIRIACPLESDYRIKLESSKPAYWNLCQATTVHLVAVPEGRPRVDCC
jgi:hypothetical protein